MKKPTKFNSKLVIATVCVAAAGWMAAQAVPVVGPETTPPPPQPNPGNLEQAAEIRQLRFAMMKLNRCSQLIGATVENQQGVKLGKIQDVVVDFDHGNVSYCVLSAEHGILAAPKYLAVPLSALTPAVDGWRVFLNADKETVANAQGFDPNHWPSVSHPAWGAQPLGQTAPKAPATAPSNQNTNAPSGTSQ